MINEENEKKISDENSWVISEYLSSNILEPNIYLYLSVLLSAFFLYQKINDNFIAKWQVTFYPLYIYLIALLVSKFTQILKTESDSIDINKAKIKVHNLSAIISISNFFSFVSYIIMLIIMFSFHKFLDDKNDDYLKISLQSFIALLIWLIFYYLVRKIPLFSLSKSEALKASQKNDSTFAALASTMVGPILTYLSNMMILCNGGMCTQIYVSTITSLLGAFGVTLTNLADYMFPITCILLGISVYSLYAKRRKLNHRPFILGVVSAAIIIVGKYFDKSFLGYLVYPGNIMMIGAAIWNAKKNKFYGLPC